MNKYFKLIIQILYPFVCGLLVWLFLFDSESNRITDLIFGTVYIGISIILPRWIYKENNVTIFFSKVGIMVVGGAISIPLFLCVIYAIYFAYLLSPIIVIISILAMAISALCYFVMSFQMKSNHVISPTIRLIMYIFVMCAAGCFLVMCAISFVELIINEPAMIQLCNKWTISITMINIFGITILSIMSIVCLVQITKDVRFVVYEKEGYLLFLRSFRSDERMHDTIGVLNEVGVKNIVKIGDPSTILSKDFADVLYLPTSHWKRSLNYYISRARYICLAIDSTQGITWEMFKHVDVIYKSLYIVCSKKALSELLESKEFIPYSKTSLGICLLQLEKNCEYNQFAFSISNDSCYYAPLKSIVPCFISGEFEGKKDIQSFPIQQSDIDDKENSYSYNTTFDMIVDRVRKVSRVNKIISKIGTNSLAFFAGFLFILMEVLMAIAGLVGGIALVIDISQEGFCWEKIFEISFAFGLSTYLIKDLKNTFYKK